MNAGITAVARCVEVRALQVGITSGGRPWMSSCGTLAAITKHAGNQQEPHASATQTGRVHSGREAALAQSVGTGRRDNKVEDGIAVRSSGNKEIVQSVRFLAEVLPYVLGGV